MAFPFFKGERVRHNLYGRGIILSFGYRCATVQFMNGIHLTVGTDNLTLDK